jgi:3-hydroxymyristoyl/3-hydroxydecanoyl-(acyl carrier protein) dehydratase
LKNEIMGKRFRLIGTRKEEREWTFDVEVPRDSPFFDGHFPGQPVLPAIAQLAILTEVYCGSIAPGRCIAAIPKLRLQQSVAPEQRLTFHVGHPDESDCSAFAIRRKGKAVSRGTVVWRDGS